MPEIRNCKKCGRIFSYAGGAMICSLCINEDDEAFKMVKDYLNSNPGASLLEVSSIKGISVQRIRSYLKEGRLEIFNDEDKAILDCKI